MIKMVHAADIHAGHPISSVMDTTRAAIRRREIQKSLERIVELARSENAQILLVAGDLFEHKYVSLSWVRETADLFRSVPDIRVYIAPGNHDPLVEDSPYCSVRWPENVTVFSSSTLETLEVPGTGVKVTGYAWTSHTDGTQVLKGKSLDNRDYFNVLLVHGEVVDEPGKTSGQTYLPISPQDIGACGAQYIALGHIHKPSEIRVGDALAVYPGSPEPLDFGEIGKHGVYLVVLREGPSRPELVGARFIPMASREVQVYEVDVTGLDTEEKVRNAILGLGTATSRKNDMWKVRLIGAADASMLIDAAALEKELSGEFYSIRIISDYYPDYDVESLCREGENSLQARFVRRIKEIAKSRRDQGDERGAAAAELALYYGLDALNRGEILFRRRRSE